MKKCLVILFAIALCLLAVVPVIPAWAVDPGTRYADAFVLIEQGQAAEEKADLATAYHNYQSALSTLHSIRTDSPDWNAQMVEYRLKDCQARFDAIKTKLPEPPPAPATAASVATAVTPVAEVPPPPTPVVTPPAPPPAPVVKATTDDQSVKLKTEINKLETENHQLKSDLTDARRAARSSAQVDALAKENKDLKAQLAVVEKKAAKPVPAPVDSNEVKKLQTELTNANAEIDRLKKASTTPAQNFQQGSSPVIASPVVAAPASDSAEIKKLRAELNKTRAEADDARKSAAQVPDLQKQNKDLSAKLASAEKKTNIAPTDSSEVKSLRAELDRSNAEVADLKKQVAAKPVVAPAPAPDSGEVKSLRAQLADTQKQLNQAKDSASHVADLEKQNKDLSAKLAAVTAKPVPADNSAELKKLRDELDATRAEADKGKKASARVAELEKENKDLNSKLTAEKKEEAEAPTVSPDARVMKHLRDENSYLRNLLDTYAEQNSELKGQLRRHDQNQSKSGQ
jgi:hypothetical protein